MQCHGSFLTVGRAWGFDPQNNASPQGRERQRGLGGWITAGGGLQLLLSPHPSSCLLPDPLPVTQWFLWDTAWQGGVLWDGGRLVSGLSPIQPTLPFNSVSLSVSRAWPQLEALLLDELEVEAMAMPEAPEVATDFLMWGIRKGSLAS